jgi:hypothetical protein
MHPSRHEEAKDGEPGDERTPGAAEASTPRAEGEVSAVPSTAEEGDARPAAVEPYRPTDPPTEEEPTAGGAEEGLTQRESELEIATLSSTDRHADDDDEDREGSDRELLDEHGGGGGGGGAGAAGGQCPWPQAGWPCLPHPARPAA